ncbi:MAG: hypothetical protein QOE70_6476 [Chthoniobacter sp.]|jgi:glycosyltransferase involved in cell wall biosynthesis|nr:hypothetical protein [Chthoniobacter sp.]
MRVLLVSHRFPPDYVSGVERYTEKLAGQLAADGDEVSVAALLPSWNGNLARTERHALANGVTLYRFNGGDVDRRFFLNDHAHLERLFHLVMLEAAPDVVHINHLIDLSPRFIQIARRLGAAVVLTLHDFYFACPRVILLKPDGSVCAGPDAGRECARACFPGEARTPINRWGVRAMYFRQWLGMAERVICPAGHVGDFFRDFSPAPERIQVLANPTWIEPASALPTNPSAPVHRGQLNLAFLGSIVRHKGLHVILEAIRQARIPAVRFTLLGQVHDLEYERELKATAATIEGLDFRLQGAYEASELSGLLADVDSVVIASQWPEIFCLVKWEALVHGVPALVSNLGALPEGIVEGENGFTFDYNRPDQLAALLRRIFEDEQLLPRLREGARRTAVIGLPQHAAAIRQIYREAIEDFNASSEPGPGDSAELRFLHAELLKAGFGPAVPSHEKIA